MVNVDTVYQRVLAISNKEQRGYITPQEFNLYANQAQMEIFEQYFYDLNQFRRLHGNQTDYADVDDMLQEKLQIFERSDGAARINNNSIYVGAGGSGFNKRVPEYIYRINRVELNKINCEILNTNDFNHARVGGPLIRPSANRPIVNIRGGIIRCLDGPDFITPTGIIYFKVPDKVQWGYVVVNGKALHNSDPLKTTHFELHNSEQSELVYKILKFAGISIVRQDLSGAASSMEMSQIQQEKQ